MNYALCLAFLDMPYFFMFTYFEQVRLAHRQHKNIFKIEVKEESYDMALHGHMSLLGSVRGDNNIMAGSSLEGSPDGNRKFKRGNTVKVAKSRRRDKKQRHDLSFNSSDVEAYRHENPIPVLKQAYTDYQRKKRKA